VPSKVKEKEMSFTDYLFATYKDCRFRIVNEDYDSLIWEEDNPLPKPSLEEYKQNKNYETPPLSAEQIAYFDAQAESVKYQSLRSAAYPPITDYIDGVVKGDQAQIDEYIAACQAVKAKYPKPE